MARKAEEYEYTYMDPRLKADIESTQRAQRDKMLRPSILKEESGEKTCRQIGWCRRQ